MFSLLLFLRLCLSKRWGGYCLLVVNVLFVLMFAVSVMLCFVVVFVVGSICVSPPRGVLFVRC